MLLELTAEAIVKEAEAKGIPWMSLVDARFFDSALRCEPEPIQARMSDRAYAITQ